MGGLRYHLYTKRPKPKASSMSYIHTVEPELWYASMLMFTILTATLWGTIKVLNSNNKLERAASIPTCFLSVLSGFWSQGVEVRLVTYSARILAFFTFVPGYMLYCAINAVLVAELATFTVELPFKSLNELKDQRALSLCVRTNSFVYNAFTEGVDDNKTVLPEWSKITNAYGCSDINDQSNLAHIICNNGIVILENRVVMATVVKNFVINCEVHKLNVRYFVKGNSYVIRDGFIGHKHVETVINLMKSTGVMQRLETEWIRKEIATRGDGSSTNTPQATIQHISGVLYVYSIAILTSFLVLLIEIIINKYFTTHKHTPALNKYIHPFVR